MGATNKPSQSAAAIIRALTCGDPKCPCTATASKGGGPVHCPAHEDRHPSLCITEAEDGFVLVRCRAGCPQEAVIAKLQEQGLWLRSRDERRRRTVTGYEIRDVTGRLVAIHERRDRPDGAKAFIWRGVDGSPGLNGRRPSELPLYGSQELPGLPFNTPIVVTEGEKARDALVRRGLAAVATVTGAAGTPGPEALRPLLERPIILWADNDLPGRAHMQRVGEALFALGHRHISMVGWREAPSGGDAADFVGGDSALKGLLDAARPWPSAPPVEPAALLNDVRSFIRRYVVLGDYEADAASLWVAHTWTLDAAEATPYLSITSPEKRSGKTRLLEVLSLLVAKPWLTARVTAAVLVRKVAAETPTLLLDESDAAFKGDKEYAETLRAILNAGHHRRGVTSVCVNKGESYRDLPVFCAKAIAGIGKSDTVADRTILIVLKRRAPTEAVQRFRQREAEAQAAPLSERLSRRADASKRRLADARPDIPTGPDDRAADSWEPLLAIADLAGEDWPQRGRRAALALSTGDRRDDDSVGVRLLRDIQSVFQDRGSDRLASSELVKALVAMEEAPWGDLRGKLLDERALARLLRPYGMGPHQIRFGEKTLKGYERADFADAWQRYVPLIGETRETLETKIGVESNLGGENVSHVSDVSLPRDVQKQLALSACTICGLQADAYTSQGEGRCEVHYLRPSDGPLVRFAVEALRLSMIGRQGL